MSTSTDSTGTRRSLFAFAAYLQDRGVGRLSDIRVGAHQFIGAQTGQQGGQNERGPVRCPGDAGRGGIGVPCR